MITATIRTDDARWPRLYVTIDGTEYLFPASKDVFLAQGATLPPEGWTGDTVERYIFPDLRNEDAEPDTAAVIVDPVLVGLVIRARNASGDGPVIVPTAAEGQVEIDRLRAELTN